TSRSLFFALSLAVAGAAHAQIPGKTSPTEPRPQPQRTTPTRDDPARTRPAYDNTTAGSPDGVRNPGNTTVVDTAVQQLVLDPGQAERIRAMDKRYSDELSALPNASVADSSYMRVMDRRAAEMATILTPAQYERWRTLSGRAK
ncbi:MAG TPA: hypothetical protein VHL57_11145, partial [Flavobacteriales bacterium]|nr:hypothetical protein [Flavobacteriales bacterium]